MTYTPESSTVSTGGTAKASEYNDLRTDALRNSWIQAQEIATADSATKGSSSTSEETLASTTISASDLSQGTRIDVRSFFLLRFAGGDSGGTPTDCTVKLKIGGNAVFSQNVSNAGGAGVSISFDMSGSIVIRTDGASGTANGGGSMLTDSSNADRYVFSSVGGTTVAVDTTASVDVELTIQFDTNNASNEAIAYQWNVTTVE